MKNFKKIKKISIIVPIYNEEKSLPQFLKRIIAISKKLKQLYELIFIDDGSIDNSNDIIKNFAKKTKSNIKIIILNKNYGQHKAIIAGFKKSNGDLIITLDADLQNPPEKIPYLIKIAEKGYDVVNTRRINRKDSFFRRLISKLINIAIRMLIGKIITDYGCMFRAYRNNIIQFILKYSKKKIFIPILANFFAMRTIEIDVYHEKRRFGSSKYNFTKLINLMFDVFICLKNLPLEKKKLISFLIFIIGIVIFFFYISIFFLKSFLRFLIFFIFFKS